MNDKKEQSNMADINLTYPLENQIKYLLNVNNREKESNTPDIDCLIDFVLAKFLFENTNKVRDEWWENKSTTNNKLKESE